MNDYQLEDTVYLPFTTRQFSDGVPTALLGTPAIDIYEDATATPIITGETLVVSLNSVVGFNMITVTATAVSGFNANGTYTAIIQAGTVGGVSVVGEVVGRFSIERNPVNWAKVAAPTTAVDLSGTDIQQADTVVTNTDMRGTDGVDTATMRGTDSAALASVCLEARLAELDAGNLPTDIADIPTVSEFNARTILSADYFDPAVDAVANVTLVATSTNLTNLPSIPANWLTAAGINAAALNGKGDWNIGKTGYAVVSTGLDLVLEGSTFIQAAVSGNWNALLTGATFNIATSAGRRLRQLETGIVLDSGTLDAATSNTADLETGVASTIDDFYNHNLLVITSLTGVGQVRVIVDYTGSGNVALISPPWVTTPDATSTYDVIIGYAHAETTSKTAHVGLAQAGATGTITLSTAASAMTDFYKNDVISIDSGTGEGQERIITAYNGTSKVATVEPDWLINPDSTSNYVVEEALCVADVFAMHHSQPAADNLKLDYDGTGFTRALSTIGTVTVLTGHTPQTGDTFPLIGTPAADVSADIAAVKVNTTTDIPALIAALNDIAASDILTTALTESYAAVGVAPTLAQALFRIQQHLGEFGVIGTTLTVRKIDGSTPAMTFTLDDATDPTDTTRAT